MENFETLLHGNHGAVIGGLLGTLFTWAVTALGAALVFCMPRSNLVLQQKMVRAC